MNSTRLGRLFGPLVLGLVGYVWLMAGIEKLTTPGFVAGMSKTLAFFASKNPYPGYKDFLLTLAVPNATPFAYVVEWGELLAGVALILAAVVFLARSTGIVVSLAQWVAILALAGGTLMSVNYFFAAGWTSISTFGENQALAVLQVLLLAAVTAAVFEPKILADRAVQGHPYDVRGPAGARPVAGA